MKTYNGNELKAYNGDGPYIFVSYSHADKDRVYPFIEALQKNYNVWYDEGIDYYGDWVDVLTNKILGCHIFLFFVTENSVKSKYCKNEIVFAFDKDTHFINILLDDFNLPEWFKFQFGTFQMCKAYGFKYYGEVINDLERKCLALKTIRNNPLPNDEVPSDDVIVTQPLDPRVLFWNVFHDELKKRGNPFYFSERNQYAIVNKPKPVFSKPCVAMDFLSVQHRLRINFFILDNIYLFNILERKKEEINHQLGCYVDWTEGVKRNNTRRIQTYINFSENNKFEYIKVINEAIPIIERFVKTFEPYV